MKPKAQNKSQSQSQSQPKLAKSLLILLVMIVGLMALGAGVRAMNAGLSCPDWPLCFGKVIPDFHPAVWFEFVHRAYAGLVALFFFSIFVYVFFASSARGLPVSAKRAAGFGLFFLFLQIAAGALTVLWLVKWFAVTSHLMLATLFFCSVFWMLNAIDPRVSRPAAPAPAALKYATGAIFLAVLVQILMGGIVASTYAGSICVDWPLCDGQWVPTWQGPIGYQIIHRFIAYFLGASILTFAIVLHRLHRQRTSTWLTRQLLMLSRIAVAVVFLQVTLGVLNLIWFMPPALTVVHQSVAILLLAVCLRIFWVASAISKKPVRQPRHPAIRSQKAGPSSIRPSYEKFAGVSGWTPGAAF